MECEHCRKEVVEGELYQHRGKNLCEDCYMETVSVPKTCDPLSVRSARITRENQGIEGEAGLLPVQKKMLRLIRETGSITREDAARQLELSPKEAEKTFAVLRHCELAKANKIGDAVYLKPFED